MCLIQGGNSMDKKEILKEEALEEVSGGGCWFGARFVAPDGHDVGCNVSWYRVQYNDYEFCYKFRSICPIDGNAHDNTGGEYSGNLYVFKCKKCGHLLDEEGNFLVRGM